MSRIPRVPTAIVAAAALLTAGLAVLSFSRDASAAQDKPVIELVSQKTTTGTAYRSAISSDGRTVAYQSNQGGNLRILLGDHTGKDPAELPTGDTQAGTPSLSGDASLVSFLGDVAGGTQEYPKDPDIYVVDRRDPAAPKVKQVTGGVNDLPYQRMVRCTINNGDADDEGCEPKLSRDGRTLVAPVEQSVDAPRLGLRIGELDLHTERGYAPMMDIFYGPAGRKDTLTVTNNGALPIVYPETGPTIEGPGFTIASTTCANTLPSGGTCTVTVHSTGLGCDEESRGMLRLPATTSGGQTAISLLDYGDCPTQDALRPQPRAAAADCTGPSQYKWDLPVADDPWASEGHPHPFFVVGEVSAGELGITALNIGNHTTAPRIPLLQSPGCQLKLVLPGGADPATSCHPNEPIAPETNCTAYVEYQVPDVGPFLGTIDTGGLPYRITGHASRRAVAAWRDPGAAGNFGPAQLVSVTGTGNVPMDGTGPSVSADGRWIGFASATPLGWPEADPTSTYRSTQVFLHDTDADGNGTYKPGQTVVVSKRTDGEFPWSAAEASVSDDGTRVAFGTRDEIGQIYVYDRIANHTVWVSSGTEGGSGNRWSGNPQLSGDGYTVVYQSSANNLGVGVLPGTRIIARDLTKDFAGGKGTNELISVRPDGLGSTAGDGFPSVNQDGTEIAFWSRDLLHDDDRLNGDALDPDVYHATRDSSATIAPDPLDFGTVKVGTTSGTKPLTVTNDGLAPVRFAKPDRSDSSEFSLAGDQCTGKILRPGQSCSYLLTFRPTHVGPRSERFVAETDGGAQPTYVLTTLTGAGSSDTRTPGETSHVSTNEGRHTDGSISDNGQFVAYRTRPENPDGPGEQINVRDQATKQITQFASHDRVGPTSISADGTRVGYNAVDGAAQPGDGKRHRTMVADKAGTHPISGTETDLRYQRYAACNRREAGDSERQCRPALSGDGKTIAYPAQLDPRASWLKLEVSSGTRDPVDVYNVIDFGTSQAAQKLTVTTDRPIRFNGPPTTDPGSGFIVADGSTCTGVLAAGASCTVQLYHQACGGELTGVLRLQGATPDGQTAIPLMSDDTCLHLTPNKVKAKAASCTPIPPAPYTPYDQGGGTTNAGNPLATDSSQVGEASYMATVIGGATTDQTLHFQSGCDFALVSVTKPDPAKPKPCAEDQVLPANTTCTAVVGFRPEAADVSAATLYTTGGNTGYHRFVVRGVQDVVLTRTDPAGDASFSGPVQIGSRNDEGEPIDGTEPSLSADGRYLAFASSAIIGRPAGFSDQVYRRDLVSGRTILVSQLPDGEVAANDAFAPSLSASGDRVAFVTDGYRNNGFAAKSKQTAREAYLAGKKAAAVMADGNPLYYPSEVWARDISSGRTVLASAAAGKPTTEGDGFSYDPSLSDDGSTVGYTSAADDLVTEAGNSGDAIYVRNLDPDFSGAAVAERFNERVSLTADGAAPEDEGDSDAPSLSSDGAFTAFDSTSKLVSTDTDDYRDVYVRRRPAQLVIEPVSVNFGGVQVGKTSSARELVVRNLGPGPVTAGPTKVDPPFAAGTGVCKVALHRGESCTVDARFVPVVAGPANGLLTLPSMQGYLAGPSVSAGLTGTGTTVPPVAGFTVVPGKLAFGSSEVGKAAPASKVTLRNTGRVALSVAAGLSSAGDFGVDDTACTTLMPGATCDYPVNFVARKAGTRVGSILFRPRSQDPLVKSPADVTVGLSGVGIGEPGAAVASMTVTPKLLVFGTQILTTASAPQAVVVTNTGNVPLNVSGLTTARDFTAATAVACRTLLPGQACQIAVRFVPRAIGTQAGAVLVSATAAGAVAPFPALVRMSGATAAPTLVVEPPVVRPGQIVLATGTSFPPGQAAVLAWKNGLGTQKVVADQTGRFQNAVLVFRRDVLGQRFLTATMPAQPVPVLSAPVLVMPLAPQPPNFVLRW
ncbi:choice-of-anchor D domain-containing protein [Kribbella sp. NPDC051620]|uniref:choice-of-anchor D domain-containing protein n=1 Tax=Kribbella sp. NPDC051620 TaxID=3364120 RepID=UPI0037A41881